jgi:hypothetical protein
MTQCIADWLVAWEREDDAARAAAIEARKSPKPDALLVYKRERVATTKQAWRRIGRNLGIEGFTQKSFRYFMAEQVKTQFRIRASFDRDGWAMSCATARGPRITMRAMIPWRSLTRRSRLTACSASWRSDVSASS